MVTPLLLALALPSFAAALTPLSDDILARIVETASTSSLSWENGTLARALTDFNYPELSPFRSGFVGALSSNLLEEDSTLGGLARATLVSKVEAFGNSSFNSTTARQGNYHYLSLLDDGAAGDPASLGEIVVWANYSGWSDFDYGKAAEDEITYLLQHVPRSSNGAISHRRDQAQLWSDSTYMVPPFLAYYAAITNNATLMTEAYLQCQRYREVLKSSSGVWKHILLGEGSLDDGEWSTGNGWAAGGMVRVLATMRNSNFNQATQSQQADIQEWIEEILTDADKHQFANGLMHNYILNQSYFPDAAGPIMLAGAAYRLSAMDLTSVYVPYAERTYKNVSTYLNSAAGSDGWVAPVVNPYDWYSAGSKSPEAQSFVLIMEASRRDWVANGSRNETGQAGPGEPENAAGAIAPRGVLASVVAVVLASLGAFLL